MRFLKCVFNLIFMGVISFILGRILPKKWFHYKSFPFQCFEFEKSGKFYDEKFGIHYWQSKLPDMSKIFPFLMPEKNLDGNFKERLPIMIEETCIAEFIHALLCVSGLTCLKIWPGFGGFIITVVYIAFFNLPYIMIQRYNRPRLVKLYERINHHGGLPEEGGCVKCGY